MKIVLLVEDSPVTQSIVKAALKEVCDLHVANCVAEAMDMVSTRNFELILLDINLPDGDGFDVYAKIRGLEKYKATPILFLTARVDLQDKVRGFSLGADDYIVKPFDITELRARISAKLKNLVVRQSMADTFMIGPFDIKISAQKIFVTGEGGTAKKLDLTGNQFKVLYYLLKNPNRIVTREELLKEIWGGEIHVNGRTVDTHIYAIRRLLGDLKWTIRSVHRQGYQFSLNKTVKQSA